jgi:ABC-type amino acid transport substrate-binding protein
MAAVILVLGGVVVWLEVALMRRMGRASLREAQAPTETPPDSTIDEVVARTAAEIAMMLDLRACWYEPFPFDGLLPRIEQGRILLPAAEPGVAPCSTAGVELPVRVNNLTLGRFVLIPPKPSVGVAFLPSARDRAVALAEQTGPAVAAALLSGDGPAAPATGTGPREVSS